MLEIALTIISIVGLLLIVKGLRRFGKMRECEKQTFESELKKKREDKLNDAYLVINTHSIAQ